MMTANTPGSGTSWGTQSYSDTPGVRQDDLVPETPDIYAVSSSYSDRPFYRRKGFLMGTAVVVVLVVILGAALGGHKSKTSGPPSLIQVSNDVYTANLNEFGSWVTNELYIPMGLDWTSFGKTGTPQNSAITYVTGSADYRKNDRTSNIQKYALACLYFAAFDRPHDFYDTNIQWKVSTYWVATNDVCQWYGVVCDATTKSITAILLPDNQLLGTLPVELAFLNQLKILDLNSNYIYMEGSDYVLFSHLDNLEELDVEDNYFYTADGGLPTQFQGLTNLEKLSASYNLFQGQLSGDLFGALSKLSQLEVEANYISGSIPAELAGSTQLVYMYLRRNSLNFTLESLIQPGYLTNIFALWLDSNYISGTIPTSIGLLTNLASLSITNTTISGHIPTQMGLLTNMKRCWLYQNQLSGSIPYELSNWGNLQVFEVEENNLTGVMPQGMCYAVKNSGYSAASLSADCNEVTCPIDSCCTTCYPLTN